MAQVTINASAGDGRVFDNDATWATARSNTVGDTADSAFLIAQANKDNGDSTFTINRGFIPFDTSSIPTGSTITAVDLKLYVASKDDEETGGEIGVIQTTQASISAIATGDYDNLTLNSPTEGATRVTIAAISTSAYNTISLNAAGRGFVNPGGSTLLGIRHSRDIDNSTPGGSTDSARNRIVCQVSEDANPPQLVITYTSGAADLSGYGDF